MTSGFAGIGDRELLDEIERRQRSDPARPTNRALEMMGSSYRLPTADRELLDEVARRQRSDPVNPTNRALEMMGSSYRLPTAFERRTAFSGSSVNRALVMSGSNYRAPDGWDPATGQQGFNTAGLFGKLYGLG